MAISDNDLIERIRAGERHRYGVILERYRDKAFALAMRILHNREDAEEAVQDAFVRAYRSLGTFEGKAKFSTWLYRIVYNVCITRVTRDIEPETVAYDEAVVTAEIDLASLSIGHAYEAQNLIEFMKKTIDLMPPKYASILTLFYLQDLTHEEICEVTQMPIGTVKVHLHRARALLKEALAVEFQSEGVAA